MRYKRTWQGTVNSDPADPDLVLSRHVRWSRPNNSEYSTLNGDEPDSITCASAWIGIIPMSCICDQALIYKDSVSGMWIQAVPWRMVSKDQALDWCAAQISRGAQATWFNHGARPHRPQKTMTEQELGKINSMELTYVDLITEQGLLKFGDIDFTAIVARARPRDIDYDYEYADYDTPVKNIRVKTQRVPTKKQPLSGWKPVRTPLGVFRSISEASIAHDITPPGLNARVRRRNDYEYITMEEYLKVKNILSKISEGEDSRPDAINQRD